MIERLWIALDSVISDPSQLDRMTTEKLMRMLKEIDRQLEIITAMKNNEDWIPNITRETLFKDMEETEKIIIEIIWKTESEMLTGTLMRLFIVKELFMDALDRRNGVQ